MLKDGLLGAVQYGLDVFGVLEAGVLWSVSHGPRLARRLRLVEPVLVRLQLGARRLLLHG